MRTKEIWEEILFPLRIESGLIRFRYRKLSETSEGTILQWLVEYSFRTKKWFVRTWKINKRTYTWAEKRKLKVEQKILVNKAIRHLEREMKDLRRREIGEEST